MAQETQLHRHSRSACRGFFKAPHPWGPPWQTPRQSRGTHRRSGKNSLVWGTLVISGHFWLYSSRLVLIGQTQDGYILSPWKKSDASKSRGYKSGMLFGSPSSTSKKTIQYWLSGHRGRSSAKREEGASEGLEKPKVGGFQPYGFCWKSVFFGGEIAVQRSRKSCMSDLS